VTHTVISFEHSGYATLRSSTTPGAPLTGSIADVKAMQKLLSEGKDVYVQFMKGPGGVHRKREGAIAKLLTIFDPRFNYVSFGGAVAWDGRKGSVKVDHWDLAWLKGYTGPTKYVWTQDVDTRPNVSEVYDRLGVKLEVGAFVAYAYNTSGELDLMMGTITKITEKGDVFCKNQDLGTETDHDPASPFGTPHKAVIKERLIRDPSKALMVMTNDIMNRIMLAKLSR
jgi:hypothetical protein